MTDLFPYDIKSLIASFLRGRQLKRLVLVNHAWKAASEPYLLSRLEVPPGNYHMIDGQEEAASWAGLRQLLESQPARVSCIRKMTVFTIPRAVKDTIAILRMISPYVVSWRDFSGCMDHPMDTHCMVATISHLSLAMLPLPALENLTIHLDGTWFQTLPGVLRMTPNLKSLYVYGCMIDFIPTIDSDLWPRLDNLDTLSVKTSLQGLESRFIRMILSRCNNIKRFDLKLSPLKDDDEAALVAHLLPILASPNIEFSTVHFDISWEDGSAPDWHSQLFCYGYPDGLFFDDGYPGLKKFSCIHHVGHRQSAAGRVLIRLSISPCGLLHGHAAWRRFASSLGMTLTSRPAHPTRWRTRATIPTLVFCQQGLLPEVCHRNYFN
jgi:hypothetical protein